MYVIVVARYNEDTTWTNEHQNVVLYDKSDRPVPGGVPLRNVGREADTYLRYIVDNWDNLPEYVAFLQGWPFDHMLGDHVEHGLVRPSKASPFLARRTNEPIDKYKELYFREYYQLLFGQEYTEPTISCAYGAQWVVPRECITHRPVQFYKRLITMLEWNEDFSGGCLYRKATDDFVPGCRFDPFVINAWTLERLWGYIFDKDVPTSTTFI
jgi:hypothetical protein